MCYNYIVVTIYTYKQCYFCYNTGNAVKLKAKSCNKIKIKINQKQPKGLLQYIMPKISVSYANYFITTALLVWKLTQSSHTDHKSSKIS